jgi:hypothetical protein
MGSRTSSGFRRLGVGVLSLLALGIVVPGAAVAHDNDRGDHRNMLILDRCDPATFNAMFGEGTCIMRKRGVPVQTFLSKVNPQDGGHRAWRFKPDELRLGRRQSLRLKNRGGETHTFTEVVEFGGGFAAPLNAVFPPGTPLAVPIGGTRFIDAGQTIDMAPLSPGVHRFECLIHPWMQTTVEQRRH